MVDIIFGDVLDYSGLFSKISVFKTFKIRAPIIPYILVLCIIFSIFLWQLLSYGIINYKLQKKSNEVFQALELLQTSGRHYNLLDYGSLRGHVMYIVMQMSGRDFQYYRPLNLFVNETSQDRITRELLESDPLLSNVNNEMGSKLFLDRLESLGQENYILYLDDFYNFKSPVFSYLFNKCNKTYKLDSDLNFFVFEKCN